MVIVNPISGTKSKKRKLRQALDVFATHGLNVELRETEYAGHAKELASEAAGRGLYGVVACGGDGTVNEIGSALIGTETAMGIIPAGSGNGLARHIEIPINGRKAAEIIARGNITPCDYITVNEKPFFCTCGVGFDAAVSLRFASKNKRGLAMYIKSALDEFIKYHPETYSLSIDGRSVSKEAMLISCCNASQYGNNAFIAPAAKITDGKMDFVVVHPKHFTSKALFGIEMMTGLVSNDAKVDLFKAVEAHISRKAEGPAHIDGEPLILPAELTFKCHPGGIKMFVNVDKKPFRPFLSPLRMMGKSIATTLGDIFHK